MTIHIEKEVETHFDFSEDKLINRVIPVALDGVSCPYECEVEVLLTDNPSIQEINKENREIDAPTDVLSFPMAEFSKPGDFEHLEEQQPDVFHPETGELMLGDIVISVDRVLSQAEEYGHSAERELGFLIVHSILHLTGYDHMEENDRVLMEQKQREIMDTLKLYR